MQAATHRSVAASSRPLGKASRTSAGFIGDRPDGPELVSRNRKWQIPNPQQNAPDKPRAAHCATAVFVRVFAECTNALTGADAKSDPNEIRALISAIDKAAKRGIIHRNAATRRKARLNKLAKAGAA